MSQAEHLLETARWLRSARQDFELARNLLENELALARHICYLAQQAAEQATKAGYVFQETDYPLTHDLLKLRRDLPYNWGIKAEVAGLHELSQWATQGRYPDTLREPSRDEAQAAVETAKQVLEKMTTDLLAHGYIEPE